MRGLVGRKLNGETSDIRVCELGNHLKSLLIMKRFSK